ncbi:hypothetical protein PVAND_016876 [Polypedilum vanderplanki]|uniref:Uncharacterized protein n=1 Tax=Polypedilum vanderplanki TaxID=319348 RepID=A0A9J6BHH2_POLVA|nr:hypothetical protein PVAND_016876 [Polypedilum vanderplanki]
MKILFKLVFFGFVFFSFVNADESEEIFEVECEFFEYKNISYHCEIRNLEISARNSKLIFQNSSKKSVALEKVVSIGIVDSNVPFLPNFSDFVQKFPNLEEFSIQLSNLKYLERSKFLILKNLKILVLSDNEIKKLPDNIFDDLEDLEFLSLDSNKITELNENLLKNLKNLKGFFACCNEIEVLHSNLFENNQKLQDVILFGNKIKKIQIDFEKLKEIKQIWLNYNVCIDEYFCDYENDCKKKFSVEKFQEIVRKNC